MASPAGLECESNLPVRGPETGLSVTQVRRADDSPSLPFSKRKFCSGPAGPGGWGWGSAGFHHSFWDGGGGVLK